MAVKSMSRSVLIALICCVALAASAPYQELIPKPGYVPVYIREGDTPLSEIHPKLAEAFGELDMKMLKDGEQAAETKTIKKDMKKDNDLSEHDDNEDAVENGEQEGAPVSGEADPIDDETVLPHPVHAIDAEIMLAAETVEAAPHLSKPVKRNDDEQDAPPSAAVPAPAAAEKTNNKRDVETSTETGKTNESQVGVAAPSGDNPLPATMGMRVEMVNGIDNTSESDIASFDAIKGA